MEKLADILMRRSRKSFEKTTSEYTFYDDEGQIIYNSLLNLNIAEVSLHEVITKNVFKGIDYYNLVPWVPLWVREAGHSQEGVMSQLDFEKKIKQNDNELTNKFLYYYDCEMLMSAFQNRTQVINHQMNRIFEYLTPKLNRHIDEYEEFVFGIDSDGIDVYSYIHSLIITLASIFDLITKVAYELQEMHKVSFEHYPSLRSSNIIYGKKTSLNDALRIEGTLFSNNEMTCVRQIESLRDEIVHNGSLDFHYFLYHGLIGEKVENEIFFPDMTNSGRLVCCKQRRMFYSDCQKTFNVELPKLVNEVIACLKSTVNLLISKFDCEWTVNDQETKNYQTEIKGWYRL